MSIVNVNGIGRPTAGFEFKIPHEIESQATRKRMLNAKKDSPKGQIILKGTLIDIRSLSHHPVFQRLKSDYVLIPRSETAETMNQSILLPKGARFSQFNGETRKWEVTLIPEEDYVLVPQKGNGNLEKSDSGQVTEVVVRRGGNRATPRPESGQEADRSGQSEKVWKDIKIENSAGYSVREIVPVPYWPCFVEVDYYVPPVASMEGTMSVSTSFMGAKIGPQPRIIRVWVEKDDKGNLRPIAAV